jgi:hypothetical protein
MIRNTSLGSRKRGPGDDDFHFSDNKPAPKCAYRRAKNWVCPAIYRDQLKMALFGATDYESGAASGRQRSQVLVAAIR